jgi:Mn-dependent DtxR family transcriptional regulator
MPNPHPKLENLKQFSSERQPQNRGRKKSIFGPLAKENDLSLDDVRKVFKNILTVKSFDDLEKIRVKYPSMLTEMTVKMLRQDKLGRLTGRKVTVKTEKGEKEIDERISSYETVQYMLDRIYGIPNKVDITVSGNMGVSVTEMTPEERDKLLLEFMAKADGLNQADPERAG